MSLYKIVTAFCCVTVTGVSLLPEENYAPSEDCEGVVFPWILTVFDVTPFDVIKVLESFVTAESCFSKDIVKV